MSKFGELAEWSKAHDWKSCIPLKGIEGSNPLFSAKAKRDLPEMVSLFSFL